MADHAGKSGDIGMIFPGLVSVTFRKLSPEEIVVLAVKAGLQGIEWGGDIHVPHGDFKRAREVARLTIDAGLTVSSYGSYYQVGNDHPDAEPFEAVLETAIHLGAPAIRVWAGECGSDEADDDYRDKVAAEARVMASLAEKANIKIGIEFHGHTLTDTPDSAVRLVRDIAHDHVRLYWQPPVGQDVETRLAGLGKILPWLCHLHVFHWQQLLRLPLSEGREEWKRYIAMTGRIPGDRYALLEFVRDDDPHQFLKDAAALKSMLSATGREGKG